MRKTDFQKWKFPSESVDFSFEYVYFEAVSGPGLVMKIKWED